MHLQPVTLESQAEIQNILQNEEVESSELTYLTMYIWQKALDIRYAILHDCITFQMGTNPNKKSFRYPMGAGNKHAAYQDISDYCDGSPIFFGLEKRNLHLLAADYEISPQPEFADYVYRIADLINLSGKKYHSKKNHLNMFKKTYDYKYERMNAHTALLCADAYSAWYTNEDGDKYLDFEKEAIDALLKNFSALKYTGGVLFANGEICAFTISEQLNKNTAVIHIEKANTAFRGAYTAINQMHLEHEWPHLEFVNREEDLGLEGLQKAKMSYKPCYRIEKYKAIKR